jgi:hypothetical protein
MGMTTQEIQRDAWRPYLDELSKRLGVVGVTIEVAGRDIGDQLVAEDLVLTWITYDHRNDIVVIGLDAPGGLREEAEHLVDHPQRILVATGDEPEAVVDIQDGEGRQHLVRMRGAPALPVVWRGKRRRSGGQPAAGDRRRRGRRRRRAR